MKKRSFLLALLAVFSLGMYSCSDKVNIAAPYKNITIVYGLLDMADTAHYIRIQKAFMDQDKSGIDMAKEPDSSFYASLDVTIKEFSGSALLNTFTLSRVDLTGEGYPKDTGAFFSVPNYAYKFKQTLDPTHDYRIVVKNAATGESDSGSTPVINTNLTPVYFGLLEWQLSSFVINFAKYSDPTTNVLSFDAAFPPNAGRGQVILRFNWNDSNVVSHSSVRRHADFTIDEKDITANARSTFSVANINVYAFLRDQLGTVGLDEYHFIDSCDMFVYAAGEEYARYNRLNNVSGGLNANEIRPIYTNMKGQNIMGLFSTRGHTSKYTIGINDNTRDSIAINPLTKDLNIRWQ